MSLEGRNLSKYHGAQVIIDMVNGDRVAGKVVRIGEHSLAISAKSVTSIHDLVDMKEIRLKRGRVVVRTLHIYGPDDDIRQHLVDRHGLYVSLARALTPEDALRYHSALDHTDLGHRHSDNPGTVVVDESRAEDVMQNLDDLN